MDKENKNPKVQSVGSENNMGSYVRAGLWHREQVMRSEEVWLEGGAREASRGPLRLAV